ncbi:MAG: TspO/MBR family protein [Bacilli bacterium]|nr:tryptophan-rich sensory protein [Clostridium sp.]MDY2803764.1 TspO/MBR family protein [Bacilli bacterium]
MKKIDYKKLALYIAIPLVLGVIVGLITMKASLSYNGPVPRWIFPIAWSILYVLMGISSYFISDNKNLLNIYKINLIVNLLWPIIFFLFKLKVLAFFWILILILIVGYMIYKFYQENKLSSYLLIPYILWLVFASVLNLLEL